MKGYEMIYIPTVDEDGKIEYISVWVDLRRRSAHIEPITSILERPILYVNDSSNEPRARIISHLGGWVRR